MQVQLRIEKIVNIILLLTVIDFTPVQTNGSNF